MPRTLHLGLVAAILAAPAMHAQTHFPNDSVIKSILIDRIDKQEQSVGIVVGLIEPSGRRVISYGALAKGNQRPLDGNTIFEIGSVGKTFTSLLLADMARRGEVALDDPIAKYLPSNVRVPERNGHTITLVDLATHTSGLPRLPANLSLKDAQNPYASYTVDSLYAFLSRYTLPRDIGVQFEYSNLGTGLLGHVLARRANMDYETLVRTRIAEPLGMNSTRITIPQEWLPRFATGHSPAMKPTSYWDLPTLAGAGGLRSTANDMLAYLATTIGLTNTPLTPAAADMLRVNRPAGSPGLTIGLAWLVAAPPPPMSEVVWHNGGTGGFRSFVGFDRTRRVGVVVLSNSGVEAGVDDIGSHLLNQNAPLLPPTTKKVHTEVAIDSALIDGYVGTYRLAPGYEVKIARVGNRISAQATGQNAFALFPEGPREFFAKVSDIQIRFEVDAAGKTTGLVMTQFGVNAPAPRVP